MWKTLAGVVVGRSILLTTHSMEEAGALASRAGIMAKRMLAMGTTEYLRHKHGAAYHCHLVTNTAPHTLDREMTRLKEWVLGQFPDAQMEAKTYHGQLRFAVPASSERLKRVPTAATTGDEIFGGTELPSIDGGVGSILAMLEDHKEELRLAHYAVVSSSL
jgi:ABC-type multidrug transport system ATPase subunit